MKNKVAIALIIFGLVLVYLNRAYAHIYKSMSEGYLDYFSGPATFNLAPTGEPSSRSITYVAIGDSLTAGAGAAKLGDAYPYLMAKDASQKRSLTIKLVNLGVPGAKTNDVIASQLALAVSAKPDVVTILIGVNDIHQMLGTGNYQTNLEAILTAISKTKAKIFVLTIPFLGSSKLMLPPYRAYFDWQTKRHNKILIAEAAKFNMTVVDLYALTRDAAFNDPNYYSRDGFHPAAKTYADWANLIYAHINF